MNHTIESCHELMLSTMTTEHKQKQQCTNTINRMIRNFYGFDAKIIYIIWNLINNNNRMNESARLIHLLWMFAYFKGYAEYDQYSAKFKCSVPTFRSWVWYMAKLVSELDVVSILKKLFN
jgi:hypothetical protein